MSIRLASILIITLGFLSATVTTTLAQDDSDQAAIKRIVAGNIFLADRATLNKKPKTQTKKTAAAKETRTDETPVADSDANFILVGITIMDDKPTAFIEDRSASELRKIGTEQTIGKGTITAIHFDHIIYRIEETQRKIKLRQSLSGEAITPDDSESNSKTAATDASDKTRDSKKQSLLERMRKRRQQESQSKPDGKSS